MSRVISRELIAAGLAKEGPSAGISPNEIYSKLETQLKNYKRLPSLTQSVNSRLHQLLPQYSHLLESTRDGSVQGLMAKYMSPKKGVFNDIKINNLKAYLIKHEIQHEYIAIRTYRKEAISVQENADVSMEYKVQTYGTKNMIQFVKLLHDDVFFHSSHYNYYKRFIKIFHSVLNDVEITKGNGFCRKLRPVDLEKLIQLLIYSNTKLTLAEREELKLNNTCTQLITDLKRSDLKLSNKELFSLLELTFIESKKPYNKSSTTSVRNLYDNFMTSETFEKNLDFFKSFISYNISLSTNNNAIYDLDFTTTIFEDLMKLNMKLDRTTFKYMLKYAWLTEDYDMIELLQHHILCHQCLDHETLAMMFLNEIPESNKSELLEVANSIHKMYTLTTHTGTGNFPAIDSFQLRLLDHLLTKENNHVPGFVFQQHRA